jgi:metal-responsive CopG/Arc/MetJ family transcriptional regulator
MVKRENRITVDLSDTLLAFVNQEVDRRGLNPKKRSTVLIDALSEKFNRMNAGAAVNETQSGYLPQFDIEEMADKVVERAFEKIEIRLKKQ